MPSMLPHCGSAFPGTLCGGQRGAPSIARLELFPDKSVQQNETMNAVPGTSEPMHVVDETLGEIHVHMYMLYGG